MIFFKSKVFNKLLLFLIWSLKELIRLPDLKSDLYVTKSIFRIQIIFSPRASYMLVVLENTFG